MGKFNQTVLWTDDEIDLLKPHIIFLENKGFNIVKSNSGNDAINILSKTKIDINTGIKETLKEYEKL